MIKSILQFNKFEHRAPAAQNAIDIFSGKWACDLGTVCPGTKAGTSRLFTHDSRPKMLAEAFGSGGRLDGMSVLELGPLEGGHTYQLEHLGAREIVAIEANVEAYLKCLIVKEITGLKSAKFMLGDFREYLLSCERSFDIVMCSGVLYHMVDPIELIQLISRVTSHCFVWTHYYDELHYPGPPRELVTDARYPGVEMYALPYTGMGDDRFWGGNKPQALWLRRDQILNAFSGAGLSDLKLIDDTPDHPNGACCTFVASRP